MTVKRTLYWIIPSLFCVVLYWHGLRAWFQMDDFAWLGLHRLVTDFDSLISTLFRPMAQGTVRPLSERLFFLGFWHLFGMEALPYRIFVFATQFSNLALITIITRRLTGSSVAGFLAPILWLVSPVIYEPMVWTSAYNQILCAFFLLLEFYLLLRWVETGSKRWYAAMWIAFLLGFGALELNVVFPALAVAYLLLFARRYLPGIAPMFLVSLGYAFIHRRAARGHESATYAMNLSPESLLSVFGQYVQMAYSAYPMAQVSTVSKELLLAAGAVALVATLVFAVMMALRRSWLPLFLLAWFVITIAPYIPLAHHVSDYYLTVPMIGLAILGSWGTAVAWRAGVAARALSVIAVLCFAIPGAWQARYMTRMNADYSRRVRTLVRGLAAAHKLHPTKVIVLKGLDDSLFWRGVYDRPHLALGWTGLYVTADTRNSLTGYLDKSDIADRFLPEIITQEGIRSGSVVVYDASQGRLRNVTDTYGRLLSLESGLPRPNVVNVGSPLYSKYLKDGWYAPANGYAWMQKNATVVLRGPASSGGKLGLHGFVTPRHTSDGPLIITASINGKSLGSKPLGAGQTECNLTFDIPDEFVGLPSIEVTVSVDRTIVVPPDTRSLGVLFGIIDVAP